MCPESANPAGGGDISEDELRKILGDDYDSVVGKGEEAGPRTDAARGRRPTPVADAGAAARRRPRLPAAAGSAG